MNLESTRSSVLRCVFRVSRDVEWTADCKTVPEVGSTVTHEGSRYAVLRAQWWIGGASNELDLSDALVELQPVEGSERHHLYRQTRTNSSIRLWPPEV